MVSFFLPVDKPNKIESIEMELTLSENHEFTNLITSYPVSEGFNTTDHIQQQPIRLTLVGLTSNTPVQYFSGIIGQAVKKELTSRVDDIFRKLVNYAGFQLPKHAGAESIQVIGAQLLTVVTGFTVYRNMAIQKISFPIDKKTGQSIQYNVDFISIRKVKSKINNTTNASSLNGKAPNIEKQSTPTQNLGKNTLVPQTNKSIPYKGLEYLQGLWQ